MSTLFLYLLLAQPDNAAREERIRQLTAEIAESGRVLLEARPSDRLADPRKSIAPGAPPMIRFRYFAGADRHRFGKLDLMLDDAGH
ncbi:hypothetical protein [uncultured Paludibaculum sp.]|uniref:hypothetical protein n=1 Tax=uncultured Paludibaculum sp. TaxID=1765020 RepID=UPI002AABC9A2|nr:hypothetical protein [uncultured Paludibaculum sp.]